MVFFTCNHCGSSLKKNRVEKHYTVECHANPSLSCMDCQKDFYGEDYKLHTKCISEDQKYSGKPLSDTSSIRKGEKKQLQWVETVRQIIDTKGSSLTPQERNILETMKDFENIPRKKNKFQNFIKNIIRGYIEPRTLDKIWSLLEEHKPVAANANEKINNQSNGEKGSVDKTATSETADDKKEEEKPQKTEVESKKKLKRNAISADDDAVENEENVSSKKKKKRKMMEDAEMQEVDQGNNGGETSVDTAEAENKATEDTSAANEDTQKLSKKERKEKKKKEKREAELQSIANDANVREETLEEESKSKKKNKQNVEEKADIAEEVDSGSSSKKKDKKKKHKQKQDESEDMQVEEAVEDVPKTVNGDTEVGQGDTKGEFIGEDNAAENKETQKLSKKEKKEKKKKEKYEAELQSIAKGADEKEEIVEEESKSKKKKKKNVEEKSDVVEEVNTNKKKDKKLKQKGSQDGDVEKEEKQDENKIEDMQIEEIVEDEPEAVNGKAPKGKFKWEKTIVSALQAAPENELLIKRLRKKVLAEYQEWQSSTSAHGISSLEEAFGTFDRKLNRIPSVKVLKDRVKLLKISE